MSTNYQVPTAARASATLIACVSDAERSEIERLARTHDRTMSREVRRAIRAYLLDPETAERTLRRGTEAIR